MEGLRGRRRSAPPAALHAALMAGLRAALMAGLIIAAPSVAGADPPGIRATVLEGPDGWARQGLWSPAIVELESGEEISGRVRLTYIAYGGSERSFGTGIFLQSGVPKRFVLPVLSSSTDREGYLSIDDGRGNEVGRLTIPRSRVNPSDAIVWVVGEDRSPFNALSGIMIPDRFNPSRTGSVYLGLLPPEDLPGLPELYGGCDMVILSTRHPERLTAEGMRGLLLYARGGGTVLVTGGPNGMNYASTILGDYLPIGRSHIGEAEGGIEFRLNRPVVMPGGGGSVESIDSVSIGETTAFSAIIGSASPDAMILAVAGRRPAVLSREVGSGRIVQTVFDPADRPFYGSRVFGVFLSTLLRDRLPPDASTIEARSSSLASRLLAMSRIEPPSLGFITLFLCLYGIIVVPVNWFLLWRAKRKELAWVTTPIIAALFTVGSFGIGALSRGWDRIMTETAVLTRVDRDAYHVRSGVGIFSPSRGDYTFRLEGEPAIANEIIDPGSAVGARTSYLETGDETLLGEIRADQWSWRTIEASSIIEAQTGDEGLRLLNEDGDGVSLVTGVAVNRTPYTIRGLVLYRNGRFFNLNGICPLGPGDTEEFRAGSGGGFPYAPEIPNGSALAGTIFQPEGRPLAWGLPLSGAGDDLFIALIESDGAPGIVDPGASINRHVRVIYLIQEVEM